MFKYNIRFYAFFKHLIINLKLKLFGNIYLRKTFICESNKSRDSKVSAVLLSSVLGKTFLRTKFWVVRIYAT